MNIDQHSARVEAGNLGRPGGTVTDPNIRPESVLVAELGRDWEWKFVVELRLKQIKLKPYSKRSAVLKPFSDHSERSMTSVEESDVGILCYISHLPGFRGILKQRYSDFIVNEVDLDGNVVHLTSLEAPLETAEEKKEKITDILDKDYSSEMESFRALAGDSDVEKLKYFVDQIGLGVNSNDESIVLSPSSDKSHRTAVHNFFKERLTFLVTDTVDGPDSLSKCVRVRLNSGSNNGRGRNSRKRKDRGNKPYDCRGSDSWPKDMGKFLRFHLYKENKDTQVALGLLGKMLGIQPRSFGFAGTKDKRSVSTQRVTVFKQRANKLAALNERLIGIKVGNFCLGAETEDIIRASATALAKNGFINYFGLQRFGSSSIATHLIGAALLHGEWKAADVTRKIREYYKESGDVEGTLRQLPRHMVAERAIVPKDEKGCSQHKKAPTRVVVLGDLVYCKEQETQKEMTSSHLNWEDDNGNDTQVDCHLDDIISITDLSEGIAQLQRSKYTTGRDRLGHYFKSSSPSTFVRDSDEKEQIKCQADCDNEIELVAGTGETKSDIQIEEESLAAASKTKESEMALKLSFTLPASCYATMAIRELLKTSTSVITYNIKFLTSILVFAALNQSSNIGLTMSWDAYKSIIHP
ncbi:hypothetical protein DH2020_034361 [Rehmannia glutinosa]|uniref:TRUD domain-containing protein n=1 Tax=Rehmannia glutinosa TaxID=99300 RepID=A0ABR0V9L3_REHGL